MSLSNSSWHRSARQARNRLLNACRRLNRVDASSHIHWSSTVARDVRTEEFVFVGPHCWVGMATSIGRYSMLAAEVSIIGDDHVHDIPGVPMQFTGRPEVRPTQIGRDVWVGRGATIIAGVTIGDGSIVGAGAVVTCDVPSREIWAGVPAKLVRRRFATEEDEAAHRRMVESPTVRPYFASRR